jgi:Family of unknown function (DUF6155)
MNETKREKPVTLKNYLAGFTKEQLVGQIIELSKKYKEVKSYYEFSLNPDSAKQSELVKETVLRCFYPLRGYELRLKEARKAVSDFKKLSPDEKSLVDVMIYYVECGVRFTNDYGDIDEPFYNSVAGMFNDAGKLCLSNGLTDKFKARAEKIVNDTSGIGWGFHDELGDTFYNYFTK